MTPTETTTILRQFNELRREVEAAGLNAISVQEVLELLDRLEEAESDALEQARLNGMWRVSAMATHPSTDSE